MMRTSQKGINLIKEFEGCRLKAYKCPAGVWTIGYGHTSNVKPNQSITREEAERLLREDLRMYEYHVENTLKGLNQNQFDALVSFTYNCGSGCLKQLTKGRTLKQIGEKIILYDKANGKPLAGLTRRRKAEQALYQS